MAGHNKWSKVKHIKAREDAKKGKAFSHISCLTQARVAHFENKPVQQDRIGSHLILRRK